MGKGDQIYRRLVEPSRILPEHVANHFAITSLFDGGLKDRLYSYRIDRIRCEKVEKDGSLFALGKIKVISEMISEPRAFLYVVIPSKTEIFRTWISNDEEGIDFEALKQKILTVVGEGESRISEILTELLGNRVLTFHDTLKEGRAAIFQELIRRTFEEHCRGHAELYDKTRETVEALAREGLEIPYPIRVAAEVTLSERLFAEVCSLEADFRGTLARGKIGSIVEEAKRHGYQLHQQESLKVLTRMLNRRMEALRKAFLGDRPPLPDRIEAERGQVEEIIELLLWSRSWGLEMRLVEAQDLMGELLSKCFAGLEKDWWEGEAKQRPFPPNLLTLAEALGFNTDRFSKCTPS
jgi:hypothetical protein